MQNRRLSDKLLLVIFGHCFHKNNYSIILQHIHSIIFHRRDKMKTLFSKWNSISLIKRIIAGLILGVILAVAVPKAQAISILGDLFVGALKVIAPGLIFFLVIGSLCRAKTGKGSMKIVILLYLLGTFLASVVSVIVSFIFPLSITLTDAVTDNAPPEGILQVLQDLIMKIVDNPVAALMNANYIGILAWAIIIGIALRMAAESTKITIVDISDALTKVVRGIISLAPFGILGLVYTAVTSSGIAIFTEYGKLIVLLVGSMLAVALILNPLIVFFCIRKNPYPLVFKCIKESGITAFFTRSSAANIPVNMQLCKSLDLDEDNYSVSIPLGATINMEGAAITINIMTLAAANTLGIDVDFPTAIVLSIIAAISACGASGVAGGSLLLIPLACSLFSISNDVAMQVVGVGFIIGVIQDSMETALNSSTDALFTAAAEFRQWRKEGREIVINKKL